MPDDLSRYYPGRCLRDEADGEGAGCPQGIDQRGFALIAEGMIAERLHHDVGDGIAVGGLLVPDDEAGRFCCREPARPRLNSAGNGPRGTGTDRPDGAECGR